MSPINHSLIRILPRRVGECNLGDSCKFRHIESERGDPSTAPVCNSWMNTGSCSHGDRCFYAHTDTAGSGAIGSKYSGESEGTAQKTIIVPTAQVGKLFGTGGSTIRRLREETLARIHIQDKDARGPRDTKVRSSIARIALFLYDQRGGAVVFQKPIAPY